MAELPNDGSALLPGKGSTMGHPNAVAALFLGTLLVAGPMPRGAAAADRNGNYTVLGAPGLVTCREWLDLHDSGNVQEAQIEAWVAGFISAYNLYEYSSKNVIEGRDPQALIDWAVRFCHANPSVTIAEAADSMIQGLLAAKEPKT
jgi:hypothetical protein